MRWGGKIRYRGVVGGKEGKNDGNFDIPTSAPQVQEDEWNEGEREGEIKRSRVHETGREGKSG